MASNNDFRRRLLRLVQERSTTITELARECGIAKTTLHSWTTGSHPTDFAAVKKLACCLGVSFSYLLTGEDDNSSTPVTIHDGLESIENVFEGFLEVSIKRLIPKTRRIEE